MKINAKKLAMVLPLLMTAACFNLEPQKRVVEESASLSDDAKYDLVAIGYPSGTPSTKAAVMNFRGVSRSFESLTGVPITSLIAGQDPSVLNDMPNYSLDSQPESLNSGMELSLLRLGTGMCMALVKKEMGLPAATRQFFKSFNFAVASEAQNIAGAISESANLISKAFCGKDGSRTVKNLTYNVDGSVTTTDTGETTSDMVSRMVRESFTGADSKDTRPTTGTNPTGMYGANNYINTGDAALMTCSAFLVSACTLVNN